MRKNWLTTITAAICAAGITATSVYASPAGMALPGRRPARPTATPSAGPGFQANAPRPSGQISPFRQPVKYFTTAMAEMPVGSKSPGRSANPVMQPAMPRQDATSLGSATAAPSPELLIKLAGACEREGNVPQARQHFQRALAMWPGHVEVLRAAARMEDRLGALPLAESLYRQAVAANPQHAGALNDLGLCLARQGKLEPSVQVIEQAIQLQPDKALYRNNVATVLVLIRQDQQALAHLAAVHGSAEANYNLGQLLVQRGRATEAGPYFQAAIDQNPDMQAAHVALAKLQGTDVAISTSSEGVPAVASEAQPPAVAPEVVPQHATPAGPQFDYPATAWSPELGASSQAPPTNYRPTTPFPAAVDPRVSTRPRYLPPVTNQNGTMVR